MTTPLTIRPMHRDECNMVIGWAREEGWNPGLDDAAAFYATDPNGFLLGLVDGEPAAAISVVRYGATFGFLGLYIVRPPFRGQGHGLSIWREGLAYLAGRTIGLDGVVAQQDNYRRSGFAFAHRSIRYGGAPLIDAARATGAQLVPVDASRLADVIAYDRPFFADDRGLFLEGWLIGAPSRLALACVRGGTIVGYGVIRACHEGHKIGPLFADDAGIARDLVEGLIAHAAPRRVFLDVPEPNRQGIALAEALGLAPVFETARMYRGPAPNLPLACIYGITTLELG